MASFGTGAANSILDKILRNADFTYTTVYVSLHDGDPGATGANEVSGGSYARQLAAFDAAAAKLSDNPDVEDFTSMPAVTVTYIGVWDSLTTGVFIIGGILDSSKTVGSGDTVRLGAGDLDITLN